MANPETQNSDDKKYSLTTVIVTGVLSFLGGAAAGATTVIATMPPEGYGFMKDEKPDAK